MTAAAVAFWWHWIAWPSLREHWLAQSLGKAVLEGKTSAEKGKAYEALVEQLQPQTLKRLEHDPDTGIAIKAAYALTTIGIDGSPPPAENQTREFAQFLTKRTGLEPPAWWIRVLSKREPFAHPDNTAEVTVKRDDADLLVRIGDKRARVTSPPFDAPTENQHINTCIAAFGVGRAYVAISPIDGSCFRLVCVVPYTGEIVWRTDVWAVGFNNVSEWDGHVFHVAEIKEQGDVVVVWGNGSGGSYVEAFDTSTGKNRLRFCTKYWFWNQ